MAALRNGAVSAHNERFGFMRGAMFDKLKKAFSFSRDARDTGLDRPSQLSDPVSEWAVAQGFAVSVQARSGGLALQGTVGARPWRMEIGKPSRDYIRGEELRARAELGVNEDVAVLLMNRPLKEALERKAYSVITDPLQTTADPSLPEEMRWLAMYEEVGWSSLPNRFWQRYALLSDNREHALAWLDPSLAERLMDWPQPGPSAEVPFLVIILRGKAYLRMEYTPAEMRTLQHASRVFTASCEAALGAFGR